MPPTPPLHAPAPVGRARPLAVALFAVALLTASLAASPADAQPRATQPSAAPPLALRHALPGGDGRPSDVIVLGLDRALRRDGAQPPDVVRIAPAVAGRLTWADPATLRFVPEAPLAEGRYTVTLVPGLVGVDGARLPRPITTTIVIRGPLRMGTIPQLRVEPDRSPTELPPGAMLRVAYDVSVDTARLRTARLVFDAGTEARCTGAGTIPLRVHAQRRLEPSARWSYPLRDDRLDGPAGRFATEVVLSPVRTTPDGCTATLHLPTLDGLEAPEARYPVRTSAPFGIAWLRPASPGPVDSLRLQLTAPVTAAALAAHLRFEPARAFTIDSQPRPATTSGAWSDWTLRTARVPIGATLRVVLDPALRDSAGRAPTGARSATMVVPHPPARVGQDVGAVVAGGLDGAVIRVRHVNVDSARLSIWTVPDSLRALLLAHPAVTMRLLDTVRLAPPLRFAVPVPAPVDAERVTAVPIPRALLTRTPRPLLAVRVDGLRNAPASSAGRLQPVVVIGERTDAYERYASRHTVALVQVSELAVHARVDPARGGAVLVTARGDGAPVAGARVTLHDGDRRASGTTDSAGVALVTGVGRAPPTSAREEGPRRAPLLEVAHGDDRMAIALGGTSWSDALSVERLGGSAQHEPVHARAALFADRDIYRPSEPVYLSMIVRDGTLGALRPPAAGDSVRLRIARAGYDADDEEGDGAVRDTVLTLDAFGTATDSVRLRPALPLGHYQAALSRWHDGAWRQIGATVLRVAEYRAPQFRALLDVDTTARLFVGDTARARVSARYLYDAPMGRAAVHWRADLTELDAWELAIPGVSWPWVVGDGQRWWDQNVRSADMPSRHGTDSLAADGTLALTMPIAPGALARPGRLTFETSVRDLDGQTVSRTRAVTVHAARLYVAARDSAAEWGWVRGQPRTVQVLAVRPDGTRVPGVRVRVQVIARRYLGYDTASRWSTDTLTRDSLVTGDAPVALRVSPEREGGIEVVLTARDEDGRETRTTLTAWVSGSSGVAWWGDAPARLPLVLARTRAQAGDTVDVRFTAPWPAEGWLTVEREGLHWQRRFAVAAGAQRLRVPVSAREMPGAFVGVLLVRRGAVRAGDSVATALRAGFASLAVDTAPRRLAVQVGLDGATHAPGDSARLRVQVRDAAGRGVPAAVTLWAVDEAVLALTEFERPDPLATLYRSRGQGLRLWSTHAMLGDGQPPWRELGYDRMFGRASLQLSANVMTGVGAAAVEEVGAEARLRAQFRTTAFFLGARRTRADGSLEVPVALPDNLTTYRVMAVAASAGDEYGSAETPLLVTRPLLVRGALPRFVRPGDALLAGGVVSARDGVARPVRVQADADGLTREDDAAQDGALPAGGSARFRWRWRVPDGEDVVVRLRTDAGPAASSAATLADAVEVRLPVRPAVVPEARSWTGVARGRTDVRLALSPDADLARTRVTWQVGPSPLPAVRSAVGYLVDYPYACTDQLASAGRGLVALLRLDAAARAAGVVQDSTARREVASATRRLQALVDELARRQRRDGAVGYWSRSHWSSPRLSADVGFLLTDARALGVAVEPTLLPGIVRYVREAVLESRQRTPGEPDPAFGTREERARALAIEASDRLAVAVLLRRAGVPDTTLEADVHARSTAMRWEDRAWLASALAERGEARAGRALLETLWAGIGQLGAQAELPDSLGGVGYFPSRVRPAARLLLATLALAPDHPRLGTLVERLLQQQRASARSSWNTQDHAAAAEALAALAIAGGWRTTPARVVTAEGRSLPATEAAGMSAAALGARAGQPLLLRVEAEGAAYYAVTVHEVPRVERRVPRQDGLTVERWYERLADGRPVGELAEGDLVRVRLRLTVPADREFVALEDPLPAGLEVVDFALRTSGSVAAEEPADAEADAERDRVVRSGVWTGWGGRWWSTWEHTEARDDRVRWFARALRTGSYEVSYVARATTAGTFVRPPAHAEAMYNPALAGRSDAGGFGVVAAPR